MDITQLLKKIILSLISSYIFYLVVVYSPKKKENRIAKDFMNEIYKRTKCEIFHLLLDNLKKIIKKPYWEIDKNYLNYEFIRDTISEEDMGNLISYDENERFRKLNIDLLYSLNNLKSTLIHTLSYDFIKQNAKMYKRSKYLIQWIDQFNHSFNTLYLVGDDFNYKRAFEVFINEFIRGISLSYGLILIDDFPKIIDDAFNSSLILEKIKTNLCRHIRIIKSCGLKK